MCGFACDSKGDFFLPIVNCLKRNPVHCAPFANLGRARTELMLPSVHAEQQIKTCILEKVKNIKGVVVVILYVPCSMSCVLYCNAMLSYSLLTVGKPQWK